MVENSPFETPKDWNEELPPELYYSEPKIEVLYRDEHFIAVNKPAGILVHPLKEKDPEKKNLLKLVKWQQRAYLYPIHRLDRPVSGIVIFALSSKAASQLKEVWHDDQFVKEYLLLCKGVTPEKGEFNKPLTDEKGIKREASTSFERIEAFSPRFSYCKAQIQTGRNHQIRRHFAHFCFSLVGDTQHGKGRINQEFRDRFNLHRIFLHAHYLAFKHPVTNVYTEIKAPLPELLRNCLEGLRKSVFFESNS